MINISKEHIISRELTPEEEEKINALIDEISNTDIENAAGDFDFINESIAEEIRHIKEYIAEAFDEMHKALIGELELLRIDVDKATEYSDPQLIRALFEVANDMLDSCINVVNKCFGEDNPD